MMRFIESRNGKETNGNQDIRLLIEQGNIPRAIELILEEINKNPSDWYLHYLLGWVHQSQSDVVQALNAYLSAEELAPGNLQLKATIGEVLLAAGQPEKALYYLESCVLAWPESSEANSLYGIALLRKGKLNQAEKILKKSCQLSNYNPDARAGLTELYSQTSQIQLIKPILEAYLLCAPDLASSHSFMADYLLWQEGDCEAACTYFDRAFNLYSQSEDPKWFRQYQSTLKFPDSELDSYLSALAQCEYYEIMRDVVKQYLQPPQSTFWRAEIFQREGDLETSLQVLQTGVEADSHDPILRTKFAELLLVNGQPDIALREVKTAIKLCQAVDYHEPWYDGLLIVSLSESGHMNEAERHFQQAKPENAERIIGGMIHYYSQLGRWDKVIHFCQLMLEGDADHALALHFLAKAFSGNNQFTESIEVYKRFLEQQPGNGRAQLEIGFVYEQDGKIEEARLAFKRALAGNSLSVSHKKTAEAALLKLDEKKSSTLQDTE